MIVQEWFKSFKFYPIMNRKIANDHRYRLLCTGIDFIEKL